MRIRPLFKHFGSKWSSTRAGIYPEPEHDVISEPFCGGAGYSLNHCDKTVMLFDADETIRELWVWLIYRATQSLVMEIPVGVPVGTDIRTLGLTRGQELLLKHWQRTNNVGDCWTISPWGDKPGQWTEKTRARVSEEVQAVKHWWVLTKPMPFVEGVTHFVDPPYEGNYAYRLPVIDHTDLGRRCLEGRGQIIVCEGLGKDGQPPTWLPFEPVGERVTSRRKKTESHHRMEFLWTNMERLK